MTKFLTFLKKSWGKLLMILFPIAGAYFIISTGGETMQVASLTKGLVGQWMLDEESLKSATVVADSSGYTNDGTITAGASDGFVTDQKGQSGKAYDFDGSATYIDCGDSSDFEFSSGGLTVSTWYKLDSTLGTRVLVHKGGQDSTNYDYELWISASNYTVFVAGKTLTTIPGYKTDDTSYGTDTTNWHHFVGTYDGISTYQIYMDGVEQAISAVGPSSSAAIPNLRIGGRNDGDQWFPGSISDVRIYNRVLSTTEISLLYDSYRPRLHIDCPDFYDSNDDTLYEAVKIGDQCWMKENINAGTKIDDPGAVAIAAACAGNAGTEQTIGGLTCYCTAVDEASCQRNGEGGTTQKYCYNNNEANCTAEGGLYEWQEAMDLAANCAYTDCSGSINTPHQGICPDGWHIPTDTEYKTLEGELGMSADEQNDTGWRGTNEGDKLKVADKCTNGVSCNSSGFAARLAGYRNRLGGFNNLGSYTLEWSSSQDSATTAWLRFLYSSYATVFRNADIKTGGFSLRCLKN